MDKLDEAKSHLLVFCRQFKISLKI